jgi:hypothetical protein
VAPAQTLTDKEYQRLRDAAVAIIREMGVECGGSNVQVCQGVVGVCVCGWKGTPRCAAAFLHGSSQSMVQDGTHWSRPKPANRF